VFQGAFGDENERNRCDNPSLGEAGPPWGLTDDSMPGNGTWRGGVRFPGTGAGAEDCVITNPFGSVCFELSFFFLGDDFVWVIGEVDFRFGEGWV